ncbi:MAG TPA: YraN family protein [Bacteroidia bacterium]|jgi:putative endonuclease
MAEHNITGQKGEEMAARYLEEKGFTILETNWRFRNLEADIIARIEKTLVIAEVKTRKSNFFGEPETFVNRQKQQNLIKTANEYVERMGLDLEVRFDIVSVVLNDNASVKHIEDAFSSVL